MKKIIFATGFCLSGLVVCAQNYAADIQKILTDFSELKSYTIKARVSISGEENYSFDAWVKSSEFGSHIRTDFSEMLVNDKVAVAVDHEDKLIRVQQGDFKEKGTGDNGTMGLDMVEEFLSQSARVEFLGSTDVYKTYVLYHDSGIEKTIIKINSTTGFFQEIEVFYREEAASISSYKIQYTEFQKNPDLGRADFNEDLIIKKTDGGKYTAIGAYKGYLIETQTME